MLSLESADQKSHVRIVRQRVFFFFQILGLLRMSVSREGDDDNYSILVRRRLEFPGEEEKRLLEESRELSQRSRE
jgi:hypothetical protein